MRAQFIPCYLAAPVLFHHKHTERYNVIPIATLIIVWLSLLSAPACDSEIDLLVIEDALNSSLPAQYIFLLSRD